MANFKITVQKTQEMELVVTAVDKIDACLLAKNKAKDREWGQKAKYEIINIESGI